MIILKSASFLIDCGRLSADNKRVMSVDIETLKHEEERKKMPKKNDTATRTTVIRRLFRDVIAQANISFSRSLFFFRRDLIIIPLTQYAHGPRHTAHGTHIMRWSVCGGAARSVSHIYHIGCLPSRKWQTLWRPVDQSAGFGALLLSRDWYGNTWRTRPADLKTKGEQLPPMKNGRSPWRDDQSRNKYWPNKTD